VAPVAVGEAVATGGVWVQRRVGSWNTIWISRRIGRSSRGTGRRDVRPLSSTRPPSVGRRTRASSVDLPAGLPTSRQVSAGSTPSETPSTARIVPSAAQNGTADGKGPGWRSGTQDRWDVIRLLPAQARGTDGNDSIGDRRAPVGSRRSCRSTVRTTGANRQPCGTWPSAGPPRIGTGAALALLEMDG